ncbi:MAG: restriction endonuclease subunit M, partial [Ignavibacteriae bacterium]|nr:restriction endonuclease subunit M [Ignavibacteriota bacterium]
MTPEESLTPLPTEETKKTIADYISGKSVAATPEEVEAVQVFSKRLVEDYGYSKEQIQTRPQFRVRSSPSDEQKKYPIDIAVFAGLERNEENLFLIVECKEPTKKTGLRQLKNYMEHSPATVGVWFNGKEHAYIRKVIKAGTVEYAELPNIPRNGQRLEDIGRFKRRDLRPTNNLKAVFKDIRNQLAGSMTGITRDQELAPQIIILLFCKIYDELNRPPDEIVSFRAGIGESAEDVFKRIDSLFEDEVKEEYDDVFDVNDNITLDEKSVHYVVGELQNYCIIEAERDVISDAFQVFIGPALTGPEGQFFTPRNVIKLIVALAEPMPKDYIVDPACGSGGFLINALERVWQIVESEGKRKSWSATQIEKRKARLASKYFRGIDKDAFLTKVTKAYMALVGDGRGGIFCDNSLEVSSNWREKTRDKIKPRTFNLVLTNPPFGKKLRIDDPQILSQYELGHRWIHDRETSTWQKTNDLHDSQPPQILFVERCLELLRDRGILGIVLPESLFCNPSHRYILEFLTSKARIKAIASMP